MVEPKKCIAKKTDGEPCEAWAQTDQEFCYPHAHPEEWAEANSRGGLAGNRNHPTSPARCLKQPIQVVELLEETINNVRKGAIELRTANCVGYLAGHLIKAIETAELEARVTAIESALRDRVVQKRKAASEALRRHYNR